MKTKTIFEKQTKKKDVSPSPWRCETLTEIYNSILRAFPWFSGEKLACSRELAPNLQSWSIWTLVLKSQIAWPYPRLFTSSSLFTACTIIRHPTTVLALFASVCVFQFPSFFSFSLKSSLCPGALTSNLWLVTCFFLFENILIFSVLTSIPFFF